jgi:hypothetical protein
MKQCSMKGGGVVIRGDGGDGGVEGEGLVCSESFVVVCVVRTRIVNSIV